MVESLPVGVRPIPWPYSDGSHRKLEPSGRHRRAVKISDPSPASLRPPKLFSSPPLDTASPMVKPARIGPEEGTVIPPTDMS